MQLARLLCLFILVATCSSPVSAKEPVLEFIEGLRHQGYYDTTLQYLEFIEKDPSLDSEIKEIIHYERGQTLLENARLLKNLNDQRKQLDASQASFEQFVKAAPNHRYAGRANTARGRILLEQARVEIWDGEKPSNEGSQDLFRKNARDMVLLAQAIFKQARDQHEKTVATFPTFIPEEDKEKRAARDEAEALFIEAQLDLAQCSYWEAQTFTETDKKRNETLTRAALEFEQIHEKYRSMTGGLFARMWQGKCFEEQDEIGIALGLYEEILGHGSGSQTIRSLKDKALRFRLICLNHEKRKDYKLTILEGEDWLRDAKARSRTRVGLGVQWEISKAHEALGLDRTTPDNKKTNHLTQALNRARTISRFPGELKTPAMSMVQRLMVALNRDPGDPKDFETANGNADLLYKEVKSLKIDLDKLISTKKKKEAKAKKEILVATAAEMALLYDIALKMTRPDTNPILVNIARLRLSYGLLLQQKHFDAAVVGEHLMVKHGEKFPEVGLEGGFIAMASFDYAYSLADKNDREFEGRMVTHFAEKIAERWPESDRANDARNAVAKIQFQSGNLLSAAEWYDKVPQGTSSYARAQVSAGKSYWRQYVLEASKSGLDRPPAEDLTAWKAAAVKHLETGITEAEKGISSKTPLPDDLVGAKLTLVNIRNLDGIYKKQKDGPLGALELLTAEPHPVLKSVAVAKGKPRPKDPTRAQSREMASFAYQQLLRAHIGLRNLDEARDARLKLEEVAGKEDAAALTQVYIEFGRELEQELDRLKAANETTRLEEVRTGFEAFLNDLYAREDGQTFYSLLWIAETFTSLADGSREDPAKSEEYFTKAADAYQKILANVASDPQFVSNPGQITGTKLRLASSLRRQPNFAEAEKVILDILKSNPSALDAQFEAASLYQGWGESGKLDAFKTAVEGTGEKGPIKIWGWSKMAQYLQREVFSKKDPRLEKLHYDARFRLAESQLHWADLIENEKEATEQYRRAQASVAGFQRISPRWPDEVYERFNGLYREILTGLGSFVVDLPRDPGERDIAEGDDAGGGGGLVVENGGGADDPEKTEEKSGSNVLLIIVMILFGGGAVAGLYFLAIGKSKKKYAGIEPTGERPAKPEVVISLPTAAPNPEPKKKKKASPSESQAPAFSIQTSDSKPAAPKTTKKKPTSDKAAGEKSATQKPKRKYTPEEIKKIKAARAAKAKAAEKKTGENPQAKPRRKPKDT